LRSIAILSVVTFRGRWFSSGRLLGRSPFCGRADSRGSESTGVPGVNSCGGSLFPLP
jgi:hypothetical protein